MKQSTTGYTKTKRDGVWRRHINGTVPPRRVRAWLARVAKDEPEEIGTTPEQPTAAEIMKLAAADKPSGATPDFMQ